jgi:predicted CXXCH cytochrome family protein
MRIKGRVVKKRYLFLGAGGALLIMLGGAGSAAADNGPHVNSAQTGPGTFTGTTDKCASCHRVHTAKGADYLLTSGQEGMCFTCHGASGTGASTDVVDGVGYSSPARTGAAGALRGGGFDYALIDSANPSRELYLRTPTSLSGRNQSIPVLAAGAPVTSNHSINTPGTAWGNGPISATENAGTAVTLECGSCHDPHGNGNYRILKPIPTDSGYTPYELVPAIIANPTAVPPVVGVPAVMSAAGGIKIPDQPVKAYTTTDYWQTGAPGVPATVNGVAAVSPDGFIANISDWCSTCHTRYMGKSGARSTDSGDAIFTYRHTTTKIDKVGTRNCITCHVAHGSNANMNGASSAAVPQPDGTMAKEHAIGQAGSRLLRVDNRGICIMCHNV